MESFTDLSVLFDAVQFDSGFHSAFLDVSDPDMAQQQQQAVPPADPQLVDAVHNVKLPPFFTDDPEFWFVTVEAQFASKNINADASKFNHTLAALPTAIALMVKDRIMAAQAGSRYTTLKDALVSRYTKHPVTKLLDFLATTHSVDSYEDHAGRIINLGATTDNTNMALFVHTIAEPHIRSAILSRIRTFADVREAAKAADDMRSSAPMPNAISAVRQGRGQGRASQPQQRSQGSLDGLCYVHRKYGTAARSCRKPCSWRGSKPVSSIDFAAADGSENFSSSH